MDKGKAPKDDIEDDELSGLTAKQRRFCEEYIVSLNATRSAIKAGYSENTASIIGWENLRKPKIKAFLDSKLREMSLSSEETLKSISDIAKASLNDYFIIKDVVRTPEVEKPLKELIKDIKAEIEDADKFIQRAKISDDTKLQIHNSHQEQRRLDIIKLEIELERNPKATRFVPGTPEIVKVADLDLVKLVQDKEAGRIKSVKNSEYGLNVEMYAADAALVNLARMHGLFEKDNSQKKPTLEGMQLVVNKTVTNDVKGRKDKPKE